MDEPAQAVVFSILRRWTMEPGSEREEWERVVRLDGGYRWLGPGEEDERLYPSLDAALGAHPSLLTLGSEAETVIESIELEEEEIGRKLRFAEPGWSWDRDTGSVNESIVGEFSEQWVWNPNVVICGAEWYVVEFSSDAGAGRDSMLIPSDVRRRTESNAWVSWKPHNIVDRFVESLGMWGDLCCFVGPRGTDDVYVDARPSQERARAFIGGNGAWGEQLPLESVNIGCDCLTAPEILERVDIARLAADNTELAINGTLWVHGDRGWVSNGEAPLR